jgi:hypothetical protein
MTAARLLVRLIGNGPFLIFIGYIALSPAATPCILLIVSKVDYQSSPDNLEDGG